MSTSENKPFVSVIIPVFNDGQRLARCLQALEAQTYRDRFEVIVVDNGSKEDPASIVAMFPHAKLSRQARPSSYAARNTGITLARGEVLAFTDSDCLPDPRWMEAGVDALVTTADCGMVGGAVEIFCQDETRPAAVEVFERITAFPQERYLRDYHYAVTANVFTWRRVMEQLGTFNEKLKSSGDNEWGNRVHAAGLKQVYCAEARVRHPARRTFGEIYRKTVRLVHGQRDWKGPQSVTLGQIFTDLRPPLGMIWRALNDPRLQGIRQRLAFIVVNTFMRNVRGMTRIKIWIRDRLSSGAPTQPIPQEAVEPQAS